MSRNPREKANPPAKPPSTAGAWARRVRRIHVYAWGVAIVGIALTATGCGPRAHVPQRPVPVPDAVAAADSQVRLARALAPVLYLQRDEWFRIKRVVAVVHPTRPIVAYHLLWRDDVHGAWIPFTVPTDQEVVWVEHDGRGTPTMLWAYWHGRIIRDSLGADERPEFNVQWGKHGSIPRGMGLGELPGIRTMNMFYALAVLGLPDIWLSNTQRKGPWCFCHGYKRYREFTRPLALADSLDVIVATEKPGPVLKATFGDKYSEKTLWPWKK